MNNIELNKSMVYVFETLYIQPFYIQPHYTQRMPFTFYHIRAIFRTSFDLLSPMLNYILLA